MKKDDITKSFDQLQPDKTTVQRMLNNILHTDDNRKERRYMRGRYFGKIIPAAALALVLVGGSLTYHFIQKSSGNSYRNSESDIDSSVGEDNVARVENQFQIDDKYYTLLTDEQREAFGLSADISDEEIGELIVTITKSVDDKLLGRDVYEYLPAGGRVVVAVSIDNEYKLFKFYSFESYIQNEDEDADVYLKLYGINGASDIDRIEFIRISEQGKLKGYNDASGIVEDSEGVERFYNYYSVLKNSSKEYFNQLFNNSGMDKGGSDAAYPDTPVSSDAGDAVVIVDKIGNEGKDLDKDTASSDTSTEPKTGAGKSSSIEGSQGSIGNALDDAVFIRIYNKQGIYMETIYYPNIGFISRYKVNQEFADFLKTYK